MISDKELREAARKYEKAVLNTLPEPEDCAAVFSTGFERKMEKLIFRVDHPIRFWLIRILPLLLIAGLIAAAVLLPGRAKEEAPALPEPAAVEPSEQAEELPALTEPPARTESVAPAEPEQEPAVEPAAQTIVYRLTWLPEGCEWDREALYENEGMTVYRTPDGTEAVFLYTVDGDLAADAAPETGREVLVWGRSALLCLHENKDGVNELFWSDGEVSFWLSAPFEEEDMIRVAESAKAAE